MASKSDVAHVALSELPETVPAIRPCPHSAQPWLYPLWLSAYLQTDARVALSAPSRRAARSGGATVTGHISPSGFAARTTPCLEWQAPGLPHPPLYRYRSGRHSGRRGCRRASQLPFAVGHPLPERVGRFHRLGGLLLLLLLLLLPIAAYSPRDIVKCCVRRFDQAAIP